MPIARRLLLTLLVLCMPLQSALALAGTPCRLLSATAATQAMPTMTGHHDHAAMMLAAEHNTSHHSDQNQVTKHPAGGCEQCSHCPACSVSTSINAVFSLPMLHSATPETPRATEALASLILDTPQRPPQAV